MKNRSMFLASGIILAIVGLFAVPHLLGQSPQADLQLSARVSRDLTVQSGDNLTITVFDTPEMSGPARVGSDGFVELPFIGKVNVKGLTLPEAAARLREKLISGHLLNDPQVTVSLSDFIYHSASVLGEVVRPGAVPVAGELRLSDLVSSAGGTNATAGSKVLISHKDSTDASEVYEVHWDRPLGGQPNPIIQSGDLVQILPSGFVYIVGEVERPGAIPIVHEHTMLSQLVSSAGGFSQTAKSSKAVLVNVPHGASSAHQVDIGAIMTGRAPDIQLADGDMLYVPNSLGKVFIQRGLQSALTLATGLILLSQSR